MRAIYPRLVGGPLAGQDVPEHLAGGDSALPGSLTVAAAPPPYYGDALDPRPATITTTLERYALATVPFNVGERILDVHVYHDPAMRPEAVAWHVLCAAFGVTP